jgi:hypothetical protein
MGRDVEIGILALDPDEEAGDLRVETQRRDILTKSLQLAIGKARVKRLVTDRMDRNLRPTAAAFRDRMMPIDALTERAGAEPANLAVGIRHNRHLAEIELMSPCHSLFRPLELSRS